MIKHQLICVVTPLGPVCAEEIAARLSDGETRAGLRNALVAQGSVHYATFTLLPPSPDGTRSPTGPALALTMAIDVGLSARDAIERLVAIGQPTLSKLYARTVPATDPDSLLRALTGRDRLHLATGGYIGARDRTVRQIDAEASLLVELRARVLPGVLRASGTSSLPDAQTLAAALSERVLANPDFAWASRQAARSKWRSTETPSPRRFAATAGYGVLVALMAVALAALALSGYLTKLSVALVDPYFIGLHDQSDFMAVLNEGKSLGIWLRILGFALVLTIVTSGLIARWEGAQVLAFELVLVLSLLIAAACAFTPILILLFSDAAAVREELRFIVKHVVIGFFGYLALLAFAFMAAASFVGGLLLTPPWASRARLVTTSVVFGLLLLVLFHWAVVLALKFGALLGVHHLHDLLGSGGRAWYLGRIIDRIAVVVVVAAALVAVLLYALVHLLAGTWTRIVVPLNAPGSPRTGPPYNRLHQTADSVAACEAELVGRTACMVSLTEIRKPYFLHANAARFFLWLISSLGWHYYSEGRLGNVGSIQFAHWHVIDRGRRMLFCANFEGAFGGYLDDFITGQVPLINVIWRWTRLGARRGLDLGGTLKDAPPTRARRFPRTRLWLFSGCRSEQQFKAYARDSMLPFQFHFEAYDRSLPAILRATQVRDAIAAERSLVADDVLLRALES